MSKHAVAPIEDRRLRVDDSLESIFRRMTDPERLSAIDGMSAEEARLMRKVVEDDADRDLSIDECYRRLLKMSAADRMFVLDRLSDADVTLLLRKIEDAKEDGDDVGEDGDDRKDDDEEVDDEEDDGKKGGEDDDRAIEALRRLSVEDLRKVLDRLPDADVKIIHDRLFR
jgi:hypothetical protein